MNNWQKYNLHENTGHGTFCDVGACNGVMTSFFKDLAGNEGMVYSFELNPYNYTRAICFLSSRRNNIKHLASNNCIMENMGVSDSPGLLDDFPITPDNYCYQIYRKN